MPQTGPSLNIDFHFDKIVSYLPAVWLGMKHLYAYLIAISIPLSLFLFIVIIYSVERIKQIRKAEHHKYYSDKVEPGFEEVPPSGDAALSRRWDAVQTHIASPNPNDWRSAIMEADIILDEMLSKIGYRGETVSDKLKRAVPGDFKTLNEAWEAHKVRNSIAHEGSTFNMTQVEANRVVQMYKKVFEEFYFI